MVSNGWYSSTCHRVKRMNGLSEGEKKPCIENLMCLRHRGRENLVVVDADIQDR